MKYVTTLFISVLLCVGIAAADQIITAGFHRRGPKHPAGGTQATCIGENNLRNPFVNRTELPPQSRYPQTLFTKESLGSGFFSSSVYRIGTTTLLEIQDLTEDLYDLRGLVRMAVLPPSSKDSDPLGFVQRTNYRWVATSDSGLCDRLYGEAETMYLTPRGNAGGHIEVHAVSLTITVDVEDNTGAPSDPANKKKYLDGQAAQITVTIEPESYQSALTKVIWDRVETTPEGNGKNNPAKTALEVIANASDPSTAECPNVRWAGVQSGTDSMSGAAKYCNADMTWAIDGTFTILGNDIVGADTTGRLVATVIMDPYINGSTDHSITGSGTVAAKLQYSELYKKYMISGVDFAASTWTITRSSTVGSIICLSNSQFFDLVTQHENRHVIQVTQLKGPLVGAFDTQQVLQRIDQTYKDAITNGYPIAVRVPEGSDMATVQAAANQQAFDQAEGELYTEGKQKLVEPINRCWLERDADAAAEIETGKQRFYSAECRYPNCVGVANCGGCGAPNGVN